MSAKIFLVVGVPGSGKTWVCARAGDKFEFISHDDNQPDYVGAILESAKTSSKPLLIEAPFSISQIMDPLVSAGHEVTPLVIIEPAVVVSDRYQARCGKAIPKGHLTRMQTYLGRAAERGWFYGSSDDILARLRAI